MITTYMAGSMVGFTGIPSAWRKRITINNQRTTELDYTNMHFAMLYHEKGLKMDVSEDLYISLQRFLIGIKVSSGKNVSW